MWPQGKRFAVCLTFDFDAEEAWLADDPASAGRPVDLSQGAYGARVGVPAILDLLERRGVQATFFVPGRVAQTHGDRVREIVAAGHELAGHGFTHREPASLTEEEEREELALAREALEIFGVEVVGYRAPGWACSPRTIGLVAELGFRYSSSFMDDVRPYVHEGTEVVELPVHWTLDDAPHFWFDGATWTKTIRSAAEVRALWEEEVLGIRDLGGLAVLTCHPQVIGRPGRLRMLDGFVGWLLGMDDVYLSTCVGIADLRPWT